ncbi:hypothetical protein LSAT2_002660 [Lamellibrachia satsuma]|nr:hypothetical protein LSAT2_002660 [Lamellibrachia satsuma]
MLNTLKYLTHATNIKKKVCINEDKMSRQMAALRAEILDLQQELILYKMWSIFVGARLQHPGSWALPRLLLQGSTPLNLVTVWCGCETDDSTADSSI